MIVIATTLFCVGSNLLAYGQPSINSFIFVNRLIFNQLFLNVFTSIVQIASHAKKRDRNDRYIKHFLLHFSDTLLLFE